MINQHIKDMAGTPFQVGDTVARAYLNQKSPVIRLSVVTAFSDDMTKMFLDNSHVAIVYPSRLLILNT